MRFIFIVTFVIILGNMYSSTATTSTDPHTPNSSVSTQPMSIATRDGTTSETSETVITESTTTSVSSTTQLADTMISTDATTTISSDSSTDENSTTPSVTSSQVAISTSPTSPESTTNTSSVPPQTSGSSTALEPSGTATTEEATNLSGVSTTVTGASSSFTSSSSNSVTPTFIQSSEASSSSTSSSSNSVTPTVIQSSGASSLSTSSSSNSVTPTVIQSSGASSSSPSSSSNSVTPTVIQSSGASPSSDSTSSSSNAEPTTSIPTTTNMTTGELMEEITTEEITSTSSTALPQTITTPTSHQTTPPYNITEAKSLYAGNSLIPVSIKVTFKDCLKENKDLADIIFEILKLDTCKSVATESDDSCGNDTSYHVIFHVDVLASSLLGREIIKNETIENITTTINSTGSVLIAELALAYSSIAACNSKKCRDALVNNKGFSCVNNGSNCTLKSPCLKNGPCSTEHGECYVQAEGNQYLGRCRCKEDDMFTYSGSDCKNKAYSWKLWTIIASGVGGGIIVILLFAVVIQCARKKSEPFNQKYGYDSGFDDRENLMYDRRYVTSDEYHRKPIPRDDVGADQVNLQSFENKGYDHWEPSESKETYASMDRHFQDPTFHAQITRPKLTTNKYSTDQLTPF
ncbi:serine-rich adhesin for platelets-like [Saccostrea cucullata]|uniref:serine-rich adhesin for platelets-like n=1 Tax=Saccostrea cuccullata TaxID=36930 RepID=UPI002ED149E6